MLIPRRPEAKDERHKFHIPLGARGASPVAQLVKNPPTMRETWVQSLGWEDPLEKGKATHSSILYSPAAATAAKSLQSCPTLCDPIDGSPPGSPIPGILQARILEWVAIPFSRGSSRPRDQSQVYHIAGRFFIILSRRGSPKNTEVGSHSLPQGIFSTQGLNPHLLLGRWILYHLSHQGSPFIPLHISSILGFISL